MPELPEVETMRRGVAGICGHRILSVRRTPCELRPIAVSPRMDALNRRVQGRKIQNIGRRGKRILLELDDQAAIVIEPRMTGLVLVADPPNQTHLRIQIELEGPLHDELLFWDRRGLGTFRWYDAAGLKSQLGTDRLGIDALSITWEQLREKLQTSQRAIKVALLDQKAVAGIGNLYAAEILHLAGIDPRTKCLNLTKKQWQRIDSAIRQVLEKAIQYEGSTLADGTYRNALNHEGGYQNHHQVYDRENHPCFRCTDGSIRRIVQAQRATFFCPKCQQKRGLHATIG